MNSGPIAIPGASSAWYQETTAYYDYANAPIRCPICEGAGVPWGGWFHCDGVCLAVAVVADGRTFLPITKSKETPHA